MTDLVSQWFINTVRDRVSESMSESEAESVVLFCQEKLSAYGCLDVRKQVMYSGISLYFRVSEERDGLLTSLYTGQQQIVVYIVTNLEMHVFLVH